MPNSFKNEGFFMLARKLQKCQIVLNKMKGFFIIGYEHTGVPNSLKSNERVFL